MFGFQTCTLWMSSPPKPPKKNNKKVIPKTNKQSSSNKHTETHTNSLRWITPEIICLSVSILLLQSPRHRHEWRCRRVVKSFDAFSPAKTLSTNPWSNASPYNVSSPTMAPKKPIGGRFTTGKRKAWRVTSMSISSLRYFVLLGIYLCFSSKV